MNGHPLVEVAYVLHRVHSTVVHGERWLSKPLKKFSTFNPTGKRRLGNLIQSPTNSVIAQTLVRRTLPSPPIMMIFITPKGLIGRSPRLEPIANITIIIING